MPRKRFTPEQIIKKLREAEVLLAKGHHVSKVSKQLGIAEQTYYRWRKEYGSLSTDQARQLKELQRQNTQLKRVVADLTLDNVILKEAANPNY